MQSTPIALKNLLDRPGRTVVSAAGVGFAIVLMFMQLGFLGAVGDTATNVYDRLDADLVIRSPEYLQTFDPRSLPVQLHYFLHSIPEIAEIQRLDLGVSRWRNPLTGELRAVAMIGIDPSKPALQIDALEPLATLLYRPEHVLIDSASRADFGPVNQRSFSAQDVGVETEVTGRRILIAGVFEMGTGLAANGALLTSHAGFNRLSPERIQRRDPHDRVSMLLIQLAPEVSVAQGKVAIQRQLATLDGDLASGQVLTLEEAKQAERWYWYAQTPVGIIFGMGVALAVIVGGVICYMVLAADVLARLPEYATLKAIGYPNRYLTRVLLGQAAWMALAAFPPAVLITFLLYWLTTLYSGIVVRMTLDRLVLVSLLSLGMCATSGWVALSKMKKAEPANLF